MTISFSTRVAIVNAIEAALPANEQSFFRAQRDKFLAFTDDTEVNYHALITEEVSTWSSIPYGIQGNTKFALTRQRLLRSLAAHVAAVDIAELF